MPPPTGRATIAHARLRNQRLSSRGFATPAEVVNWLGAVQAQDYAGAKWALAMRMRKGAKEDIERAFAAGDMLRTHVMRPTWHFVTPADIRWMLALTGPRVRAILTNYDRRLSIDGALITRSIRTIAASLSGGVQLTRQELKARLGKAGISIAGVQHLAQVMMHAELDGVICSGAPRGKQFTYALLDERVPAANVLSRDAALAELTLRYFTGHGPAQIQDFAWWSGLTTADARAGLEMVRRHLTSEVVDARTYWCALSTRRTAPPPRTAFLLPPYDEYLIAYRDRSAALDGTFWKSIAAGNPFSAPIVIDGQVVGGWTRRLARNRMTIDVNVPPAFTKRDFRLIADAASRFGEYIGVTVALARM